MDGRRQRRGRQQFAHGVDERDRCDQHVADGRVWGPIAARPALAEPRGTVTTSSEQPERRMRGRRGNRTLVDRIPNPRLAGSGGRRVRLPQVRSADGVRPEERDRIRRSGVAQYDIDSRQLLRDARVRGSRVFCQKVSDALPT